MGDSMMRADDFVTGFLMLVALIFGIGYLAGFLLGWFGHRWSAGRAAPRVPHPRSVVAKVLEPGYGAAYDSGLAMDELQRTSETVARELAKPDPLDEYDMSQAWLALRFHRDTLEAHNSLREAEQGESK